MADPTEIIVKVDPKATQQQGDWTVKVGAGRGGTNVSSHRQKTAAVKRGRREGRSRRNQAGGAVLKVQDSNGRLHTEASYGDASGSGGGILGGLF